MNENKLAKILNRLFHIVFLLSFGYLFLSIIFFGYKNGGKRYSEDSKPWIILGFLLLLFIFTAVYIFVQKYNRKPKYKRLNTKENHTDRNVKIIIFSVAGIMFIIQLIAGYLLEMNPVTDLKNLNKYALDFAQNGNFDLIQKDYQNNYFYLIRYPNNLALVFFLSFIYRFSYLIFGYVPMYVPVAVNALAINISVLLTVFIARKIFGNRKAIFVLFLMFLFVPYYTYVPYYYTDSISMPFCIGAIYLFINAVKSDTRYKKYIMTAICGVLIFISYKIKGSAIILLAVSIIFLILKFRVKKTICLILALIAGFGIVSTVYTAVYNGSNIITKEQSEKYEYPYTHWIMMGLKGVGGYSQDDDMFTRTFPDKKSKQDANIDEIIKRIENYGVIGFAKHITAKADWTWEDGTCYISHHIQDSVRENLLHSFVLDTGKYHIICFIYCCGFQLFLIFMICMSALKGCIKPEINIQTFLRGIVFSAFVFFIIWETRSRYIFNFTPVFFLLAADSFGFVTEKFNSVKIFVKSKINR